MQVIRGWDEGGSCGSTHALPGMPCAHCGGCGPSVRWHVDDERRARNMYSSQCGNSGLLQPSMFAIILVCTTTATTYQCLWWCVHRDRCRCCSDECGREERPHMLAGLRWVAWHALDARLAVLTAAQVEFLAVLGVPWVWCPCGCICPCLTV